MTIDLRRPIAQLWRAAEVALKRPIGMSINTKNTWSVQWTFIGRQYQMLQSWILSELVGWSGNVNSATRKYSDGERPFRGASMRPLSCLGAAAAAIAIASHPLPAPAQENHSAIATLSLSEQCTALESTDFSTIQDAPVQITQAKLIEATSGTPAHCLVQGYVTPNVGFELQLPADNWNGKFIEIGCGGSCGHTHWVFWCPLHRGYACI